MVKLSEQTLRALRKALDDGDPEIRDRALASFIDAVVLQEDPSLTATVASMVKTYRPAVPDPIGPRKFEGWSHLPEELRDTTRNFMDFEALALLSRTSHSNRVATRGILRKRVERLLDAFHLPFDKTMDLLKAHDAIISGFAALAVVLNFSFEPYTLDVFVPGHEDMDEIVSALQDMAAYLPISQPNRRPVEDDYDDADVCRIVWLQHAETEMRITLYQVAFHEPINYIFCFYSTILMNVINHVGVGCAYPDLTLEKVAIVHRYIRHDGRALDRFRAKYTGLGLTLADHWNTPKVQAITDGHNCRTYKSCHHGLRTTRSPKGLLWMSFTDHSTQVLKDVIPFVAWSPLGFDP